MSSAEPFDRSQAWTLPAAWCVLVAISVPILLDAARHVLTSSWALYALAFPPLTFVALRAGAAGRPHFAVAFSLVLVGISIETVALTTGTLRVGRIGFVLCVAALLVLQGRLRARAAVLLLLCVPLPHAAMKWAAEPLLPELAEGLAMLWRAFDIPTLVFDAEIEWPTGLLKLEPVDIGWTAATLGFGLAWFVCMRRRIPLLRTIGVSVAAALLGASIHLAATTALFSFADPSDPTVLRFVRDGLVYAGLGGIAAAALSRRTSATPSASAP